MRVFIAVEPEELSGYFRQLQQLLPEAKATFPKKFHLTLKFLGEVEESKLGEIKEKLNQVDFQPFRMKLGGMGVFPSETFIRVVWVGLEDREKISQLQQQVEESLEGMFKKDSRFHPHITLARIKFIEDEKKEDFIKKIKEIQVEQKEVEVKSFKLIKSTLTGEGPVYEDLATFQ